jgi:hypothetical protein
LKVKAKSRLNQTKHYYSESGFTNIFNIISIIDKAITGINLAKTIIVDPTLSDAGRCSYDPFTKTTTIK